MHIYLSRFAKTTTALAVFLGFLALAQTSQAATSCDPTSDEDSSCGLKAAVEAKYGEGYCADLYEWQDVGGATLEVHHRYTNAGVGEDDLGTITMELFPTFTDTECTIKTTSALEGLDPTYRFYHGIYVNATTNIETTPGQEEIQIDLDTDEFEYTFTGLDFDEYQFRFDSDFYDESGETRYGSTTEQDYFAPAWPALTSLTMASDGTFEWEFADGPADDDTRADIVLYEIVDGGLQFTTFTSKYAPTTSWEYYDWNNVGDGTYLLDGSEAKKSYYDDVYDGSTMDTSGQVNHGMWNEHTRKVVTVKSHQVTAVDDIGTVSDDTSEQLTDCAVLAEDGEDCTIENAEPNKSSVKKASKKQVSWNLIDGATYYKLIITNKKGKKLVQYNTLTSAKKKLSKKDKKKLLGKNKNFAKVYACNVFGCSAVSKKKF